MNSIFEVLFFIDKHGRLLARDYIEQMPENHQAKVVKAIQLLQEKDHMLRRPWADVLRDKIYELRPAYGSYEHRILYFFDQRKIVLTHGFLKKTQRVPLSEIEFAFKYKNEWFDRFGAS
jgi:phage-related protein